MKPGIYYDIPFEEYLKIDAVNKSSLDDVEQSLYHYWARNIDPNREVKPTTKPLKLGQDIHTAVLEPKRFETQYAVEPADAPRRPTSAQINAKKPSDDTIAQIAWWKAFDEANAGKVFISKDAYQTCLDIQKTFRAHPTCKMLLENGRSEVTIIWFDPVTKLLCKGRIDWLPDAGFMVDLKSADDASPNVFAKKVADYNWHVQAAWYTDGFALATGGDDRLFVFAAIEKTAPRVPAFYYLEEPDIEIGRATYRDRLDRVAAAKRTDKWHGYSNQLEPLKLPAWARKNAATPEPETY